MPRVLITGGAGFIGSHTARLARRMGWSVHVLDNLSTGLEATLQVLKDEGIEITIGDIRNTKILNEIVPKCDAIIHLAAQVSVPFSLAKPEENHDINVEGTRLILETAKKHGVVRFVAASSASVYGAADTLPLHEDEAGNFHSPYAESKWLNERQIIEARSHEMEAVALRIFNVYGPGQRTDGPYAAVIPKFIELITQGDQPIIYGDGLQTRDFVHVEDVARALLMFCSIEWKEELHHAYNVATQTEVSLLELIRTIQEILVSIRPNTVLHDPLHKEFRPGDIQRSVASIQRIQNNTEWSPKVSLEEGLRQQLLYSIKTT